MSFNLFHFLNNALHDFNFPSSAAPAVPVTVDDDRSVASNASPGEPVISVDSFGMEDDLNVAIALSLSDENMPSSAELVVPVDVDDDLSVAISLSSSKESSPKSAMPFTTEQNTDDGLPQSIPEMIECAWAQELRGESTDVASQITVKAPKELDKSYKLHAVYHLMQAFNRLSANHIKAVFLRHGTYLAARTELEANPEKNTIKNIRKSFRAPPCDVPQDLVRELSIAALDPVIKDALQERRREREARIEELKTIGGLGTCGCCFNDELLPEEELHCDSCDKHTFCIICVKNAAMAFFGSGLFAQNFVDGLRNGTSSSSNNSSSSASSSSWDPSPTSTPPPDMSLSVVRCMQTSGCSGKFSDAALRRALTAKMYARYSRRSAALHAVASGLKDLVACPGCDFMVEINDQNENLIRCLDPDCRKVTCRWCRKDNHLPLRCEEVEDNGESKIRTFYEEKLGDAMMRRCPNPKCRKPYEKEDSVPPGCNHMRCPCGTHSCYLCGQMVDKERPYDHYSNGSSAGGVNNRASRCTVYGIPKWAEKSHAKAEMEANKALEEYLEQNPELQDLIKKPSVKRKLEKLVGHSVQPNRK